MASSAPDISKRIETILQAPTANFVELTKLAGFDPSSDFRFMHVRDVDFDGCDLAGFDFTGTHFQNCNFQGARIAGATFVKSKFDRSDLRLADDWKRLNQPPNLFSLPARLAQNIGRVAKTSFGVGLVSRKSSLAVNPAREEFAALLVEEHAVDAELEGHVVKGIVTTIDNDHAVIDVGLKSEGRVALREFAKPGQKADLKVGDEVEVYVDRLESMNGEAVLSRDRARREAAWDKLEGEFAAGNRVEGVIFGRVKGGFTVDLGGVVAFLPGSQVDVRPARDVGSLMDIAQPFQILKMNRKRCNVIVSRRAILEETRAEQRSRLIMDLAEGQVIEGVVKNIVDYGAFVDLGGIDGLLHVTDLSYKRIKHPREVVNIGDTVKVQIVQINKDTQRISLGMKQLQDGVPVTSGSSASLTESLTKGAVVTVTVLEVRNAGLVAQINGTKSAGFIKRIELGRDREEQNPDHFQVGQKLEVMIIGFARSKEPLLSVKARQFWEDRQAIEEYGLSDKRASLGDILAEALRAGRREGR